MIEIPGLHITQDSSKQTMFAIDARGHSITDPTMDEGMTDFVEPGYYGLTQAQSDALVKLNEVLDTATEDALNAGCLAVQKAYDIPQGDVAALFFSGVERSEPIRNALAHYIRSEMNLNKSAE